MSKHQGIERNEIWKDEYLKWICGYANAQGGTLIFVVDRYPFPVNYKGKYYYRSGSTMQEIKGIELLKFLYEKHMKPSTMTITQLLSSRCQFSISRFRENTHGKEGIIQNFLMIYLNA